MTRPAWETLTPEQQHTEWERFNAWRNQQPLPIPPQQYLPRHATPEPRLEPKFNPWPWVIGIGAAVLVLIILVALTIGSASRTTLYGDMTVVTNTNALTSVGINEGCMTFAGYDDVAEGAPVVVRNSSNAVVATGSLSRGKATTGGCVFSFSIPDVPSSDFYSVEVTHRGAITVSEDEVHSGIHMTLGG